MEETKNKLQKFSNVVYVFSKIGRIASIVGISVFVVAVIWVIFAGPNAAYELGNGITIQGPVDFGDVTVAVVWGEMSYAIAATICSLLLCLRFEKLFDNMRSQPSPFTIENANQFKVIAIILIVGSVGPVIFAQIIGQSVAAITQTAFSLEFSGGFSLLTALLFFVMSIVFKYGCELQAQVDETL